GTRVSYGATWTTPVDSILAVVNMGYGDGLSRQLSNRGSFFHKGREVPIRGRVCMDRCIIDVTGLPDVVAGDEVTFFGDDGLIRKDASDIADLYGTIDYEIYCGINERVPRMRVD
ncbi:MAG: alanine racemase, partial [Clostridiaceae bacterium]|nr:alanine racemase [Clostridiaceae bacterium]